MSHERGTMEAITTARNASSAGSTIDEKAKAENQLVGSLVRVFPLAVQYPDLKANQELLAIQHRVSAPESNLADRRKFCDDSGNLYNISIEKLPAMWAAGQAGYRTRAWLTIAASEPQDL